MAQMDVAGMYKGASLLTRPADEYENDGTVEALWVRKACQHADIYYSVISTVDPLLLKLTKYDDRIFDAFMKSFPSLNLLILTERDLKSEGNKAHWRSFCEEFKDVEDYSFGTLLRLDARRDYSEENTILVTRIQFLAIEIARNRSGVNNYIWARKGQLGKEARLTGETGGEEELIDGENENETMQKLAQAIESQLMN